MRGLLSQGIACPRPTDPVVVAAWYAALRATHRTGFACVTEQLGEYPDVIVWADTHDELERFYRTMAAFFENALAGQP